jgi:hypothetical protein
MGASTMHAELSPSKRHRWAACPGSIREEARFPEPPPGDAAIQGTRTHTILERAVLWEFVHKKGPLDLVLTRFTTRRVRGSAVPSALTALTWR